MAHMSKTLMLRKKHLTVSQKGGKRKLPRTFCLLFLGLDLSVLSVGGRVSEPDKDYYARKIRSGWVIRGFGDPRSYRIL